MASKRKVGALGGGDPLTWALLIGAVGFVGWKGYEELQERKNVATPWAGAPGVPTTTPAAPVVQTGGGAVVTPTAPVVVGGTTPPPAAPSVATLPVVVMATSPTSVTLYFKTQAPVRRTGVMNVALPGAGIAVIPAGTTQTFELSAGSGLEVMNSAGVWVPVASPSSANTLPPPATLPGRVTPMPLPAPVPVPVTVPSLWPMLKGGAVWDFGMGHSTQPVLPVDR